MSRGIGFDFGTTNSALAVAEGGTAGAARVRVAHYATRTGPTPSFRSVLFFGREQTRGRVVCDAGPAAIERYLEQDEERRLMQSLKAFLASRSFKATSVFGQPHTLEDLIGSIIAPLKAQAEAQLGALEPPLVVGRPVRFANARDVDDERHALTRLEAALWAVGFPEVHFEYEPVAAAHHYEARLERDETVLIGDFGGGTSDFCLLRVGPSHRGRPRGGGDIIGHAGVALAGDAFDAKIVRHVVAERLGRGSLRRVFMAGTVPMPNWIYKELEAWHHLSFLRSHETLSFLYEALEGAEEPEKLEALLHVVEYDLGYHLYHAVQQTKLALSERERAPFRFDDGPVRIECEVDRNDFEAWIADELAAIETCVDELMTGTRLADGDVDRVFLTGGSAFVPAVRAIFEQRFGPDRLRGGDELVSVASGLALRAHELAAAG